MAKRILKKWIGDLGYEISKKAQHASEALPLCYSKQAQLFNKNDELVIFDIGAHKGETSTIYRNLFPQAFIHAFEPFHQLFEQLKKKFETDKKYFANNRALASKSGKYQLHLNEYSATNSLLPIDERALGYWGSAVNSNNEKEDIAGISLDDYCDQHQITCIDILKIDVQGYEFEVLKGAVGLMKKRRIGLIYTEFIIAETYVNQSCFEEGIKFLRENNYMLFNFYNPIESADGKLLQVDAIFTKG